MACGRTGTVNSSFSGAPAPAGIDYSTIPPRRSNRDGLALDGSTRSGHDEPPSVDLTTVAVPST